MPRAANAVPFDWVVQERATPMWADVQERDDVSLEARNDHSGPADLDRDTLAFDDLR